MLDGTKRFGSPPLDNRHELQFLLEKGKSVTGVDTSFSKERGFVVSVHLSLLSRRFASGVAPYKETEALLKGFSDEAVSPAKVHQDSESRPLRL